MNLISIVALLSLSTAAHPDSSPKIAANLMLVNAKIWTVDPERPEVEAVACWQGRILALGSTAEIRAFAGPKTKVVDARGRRVVPGFHDSHLHLLGSGLRLNQVALKDAKDEADFGRLLTEFDKKLPPGRWMIGGDWDHDRAFAGRLPTAEDLDKHVADRPVLLRRYDGHMALANTKALQMAGITGDTKDPSGGVIVRDQKTNQPTGLLRDNAMDIVDKMVPPPTDDEVTSGVAAALEEIRKNGITSAADMDGSDTATRRHLFRLYQRMARAGQLTARVELRWPINEWDQLSRLAVEADFGSDYVRIGGVKGFMDGSLGSSTAKMFEPYVNEPTSTGVYTTPRERMRALIEQADRAGLSVCVHAIGDEANATLLDIFADVSKTNGPRDRRFRIEHAQHLRATDIPRFGELGVVPSMQPYHVADDGRWAEGRIGTERCATSYAFRALLDRGAKLSFGSDWSVAPLSPLLGIDAAVNRRTLDGKHPGGWFPAQRISVAEAIAAYTTTSAFASHQERERGTVSVNKYADFAVLSRDILDPNQRNAIATTDVVMTITGGKVVHDARPSDEKR